MRPRPVPLAAVPGLAAALVLGAGAPAAAVPARSAAADGSARLMSADGWIGQVGTTLLAPVIRAAGGDRTDRHNPDDGPAKTGVRLTGAGVGVALIDSGVAPVQGLNSPGKVINGPDLSFESQEPNLRHLDTYGHGTHLAGIIAGSDPASVTGTARFDGVAPGAHIVSLKAAASDGASDVTQVIAAIDWVVQHRKDPGMNIRVLNLSFGTASTQSTASDPLAFAVEQAWQKGIVVVVSAGNDGFAANHLTMPAADPDVIAVGAADTSNTETRADDKVADFTNRGNPARHPDVLAAGRSVVSLAVPGSYVDRTFPSAKLSLTGAALRPRQRHLAGRRGGLRRRRAAAAATPEPHAGPGQAAADDDREADRRRRRAGRRQRPDRHPRRRERQVAQRRPLRSAQPDRHRARLAGEIARRRARLRPGRGPGAQRRGRHLRQALERGHLVVRLRQAEELVRWHVQRQPVGRRRVRRHGLRHAHLDVGRMDRPVVGRIRLGRPQLGRRLLERPQLGLLGLVRTILGGAQLGLGGMVRSAMAVAGHVCAWWSRSSVRVGALTLGMSVVAAAVLAGFARRGVEAPTLPGGAWWVAALVGLFAITEGHTVYVRVRRGAHGINLSEFPMVFGLLAFDPVTVILTRSLAGGLGLWLFRKQRGGKLAFNAACLAVQGSVAVLVFSALAPHALGVTAAGPGLRAWLGAYAAMVLADVVAIVLVTAVIAVHDDPGEWRRLPAALRSVWIVAVTTTVSLISYAAAVQAPWALALVGLIGVVMFLAYRAYDRLSQGNAEVRQLYDFTSALDGSRPVPELCADVLDRLRDVLRANTAELVHREPDGIHHVRLSGSAGVTSPELGWAAADAWLRPAVDADEPVLRPDGMAVPISTGDQRAALVVTDSLPDSGPFTAARLTLFQALANHAGAALGRASLFDRLRQEVAEKQHLSLHDPLSGLPNRRYFTTLLEEALAGARKGGSGVAVMLLDLDRFKEINDALGHDTGDALLRQIGERLRVHLGSRGVVARLGGDEFAVLLPTGGSAEAAVAAAAELGAVVERAVRMDPMTITARASIGVATAPLHGDDAQTLMRHADVAMYAAKEHHTGLRLYDPAADRHSPQRLALIADLRAAVENRDLMVVFQPKVEPRTGRVAGAEALARWRHPDRGPIPPDVFIPLAEHSGLILPLTLHVLEVALRRRAAWAARGHDLDVAVNLSPNSLLDGELPETVALLLAQTGSPPHRLTLEITEGAILADPEGSTATLRRLHALGVKLSIDDFGTGYSSLGRLRTLPIHEVKIDKSFVQRSAGDHRDRAVVRSAVQLGHALDLQVVAEGVEDRATYAYLAQEGCDVVQGFLLSRPLPGDQFLDWVTDHATSLILSAGQD
jgi:diguanylate cyclase (GGDEF)-like protein